MPLKDKKARTEYWRKYRERFPEKVRATKERWERNNPEKNRQCKKQSALKHTERRRRTSREYYLKNREICLERSRAYRKNNPEHGRAHAKRQRARRLAAPINDFTAKQWEEMKIHYHHRCVYCARQMKHLTQDHIQPLSQGGSHTKTNIVPACRSCNSRKHIGPPLKPVQPLLL